MSSKSLTVETAPSTVPPAQDPRRSRAFAALHSHGQMLWPFSQALPWGPENGHEEASVFGLALNGMAELVVIIQEPSDSALLCMVPSDPLH